MAIITTRLAGMQLAIKRQASRPPDSRTELNIKFFMLPVALALVRFVDSAAF